MDKPSLKKYRFEIEDRFASTYDIPLHNFLDTIEKHLAEDNLNLDPDFQRGRVWTQEQQISFCEFVLKGGKTNPILFNHPGWMKCFRGEMVVVDGLQRITALTSMLKNKLPVFGYLLEEFDDTSKFNRSISVQFKIHSLQTRPDVLRWYLQVNSTGTPHSTSEIDRVRRLLEAEG